MRELYHALQALKASKTWVDSYFARYGESYILSDESSHEEIRSYLYEVQNIMRNTRARVYKGLDKEIPDVTKLKKSNKQ